MRHDGEDFAYLLDMLRYAEKAASLVAGRTFDDYLADSTLQLAVERAIEIVGEAARRVSREFQNDHPTIPWQPIVAQRHILAHEYGEIQADRIWRVATVYLPELIPQLRAIIPPPPTIPSS